MTDFVAPCHGPGRDDGSPVSPARLAPADISVRLYGRRPRGRRAAVARALTAIGHQVDHTALQQLTELLPWWAIFDESQDFQPGLSASRSRAVRYRRCPKAGAEMRSGRQSGQESGAVLRRSKWI